MTTFSFTASNDDLTARFSCPNHQRRIGELMHHLCIDLNDEASRARMLCRYTAGEGHATFCFDGEPAEGSDIRHEAVFFENTEYPLLVRGNAGRELTEIRFAVNDHLKGEDGHSTVTSDGGELYGSLNFHNQVGLTDITIIYKVKGERAQHRMRFTTEVLSYKLDYRTDMKTIIADIEHEYAMLSASFLKDTYLSMRQHSGETSALVWWQIFRACHDDIVRAARQIIDRPKRRLRTIVRYERAERLAVLPREMENEYQQHRDNPTYLYRTEDMTLSHDTIENRFLKHALTAMLHRFLAVKEHILTAMHLDHPDRIDPRLQQMERELQRLRNHSFFRGVGVFRGFRQDSLVMKQAAGYKTILEKWLELQQGYELEEGVRKLEVKDISDLYEIWCFIKVKNIVADTLRDLGREAVVQANGRNVTRDFIPQLVHGGSVSFIDSGGVELACVSYNATVEKAAAKRSSAISGTNTMTTEQRPDIVLRLSRTHDGGMKYTYLFDAKYRIDDVQVGGCDVPPEDAIDQMHRYRDAIYYTEKGGDRAHLKKEIIAGYVLFPGQLPPEALDYDHGSYYYQQSNRLIGIGAFPLRPDQERHAADGSIVVDANSTEQALRQQIRHWLEDGREQLLEQSIPQKGLEYTDEPVVRGSYFLSTIDQHVNDSRELVFSGGADSFVSGYTAILSGVDFQKVRYFAPVHDHRVKGFYRVEKVEAVDMSEQLKIELARSNASGKKQNYSGFDKPIRIRLTLGEYEALPRPFVYGLNRNAARGVVLTRKEFREYCEERAATKNNAFV